MPTFLSTTKQGLARECFFVFFYKQHKGSPWINNFAEAERWMNEKKNKRLNLDNIERPNTKWTFIKFSNIEVKAVLDNQPVLGTGPE